MTLYLEPRWKSYIVETTEPVLTPVQCDDIIKIVVQIFYENYCF